MSTNLMIQASCKVTKHLFSGDVFEVLSENFDLWQTPTEVTSEILGSNNPLKAYEEWVSALNFVKSEPVFNDDCELIGHQTIDLGAKQIKELKTWIEEHQGWEIDFCEI